MKNLKKKNSFIERATNKFRGKFDYSNMDFTHMTKVVNITCPTHDSFSVTPIIHLQLKYGCPKCGNEAVGKSRTLSNESCLKKFKEVHGDRYDYSKVIYTRKKSKVKIICYNHGEFQQTPNDHCMGKGCPMCSFEKLRKERQLSLGEILSRASLTHKGKYTYDIGEYKSSKDKINIICPIHGLFSQAIDKHLVGRGCPKCSCHMSKAEDEIITFIQDELGTSIIQREKSIIKPYEIDIFLPELNKAIEFNGEYWHYSRKFFTPGKHSKKSNLCRAKGIRLLHIRESKWIEDKENMKGIILKFLKKRFS